MRPQLTALDLHYLLKELRQFISAKVDQIYCPSKKEIILQLYLTNAGKKILIIKAPDSIWLADAKPETKKISGFCKTLRKYLGNSRLKEVKQFGFERIIEFVFEKEKKYSLIFEMFSKGNIILVKNKKIIAAVEYQKWAARTIRPNEEYKWPAKEFNFLELKLSEFKKFIAETNKESVVKALAIEIGLGGKYAEEACNIAKVDKNKQPNELNLDEIKKISAALSELKKKTISDITHKFKPEKAIPLEEKKYLRKVEEMERIIAEQQQKIKGLENAEKANKRKAEIIYEKYTLIKEIIEQIKQARKKYSWKEIKDKLKGHKIIKEINEKEKKLVLEL